MPIVNSVLEETPQSATSIHIVVRNYDQDGKEYMYSFDADQNTDVQAIVDSRTAALNEQLANDEFMALVQG